MPSEPYKLRYVPVGTREFSKTQEGSCKGECSVQFTGLKPQPYEVILKSPEGREGREKTRRIIGTPVVAEILAGQPVPAHHQRQPGDGNGQKLRLGQTLTAAHGEWSNEPTQFTYQWLRCEGNGEAGASEELGSECEPITTGKGPATGETYEVQPQDVSRTIAVKVEAKNASGIERGGVRTGTDPGGRRRIRTPLPHPDRAADAERHGRRRADADRAPRLLGKLADGARRQVVPLQRGDQRRDRRHLRGDHGEKRQRRKRTRDR